MTTKEAFDKYTALLAIEQGTNTKTTRTRDLLLRSLDDNTLIELATMLRDAGIIKQAVAK